MEKLKELQKSKAVECLKKLNILDTFIEEFRKNDIVSCFVEYNDNLVLQDKDNKELITKIREIEAKYNSKVYAVMINITKLGTYYDFLYVSQYIEEWEYTVTDGTEPNMFIASSYCWNKDKNLVNEFGFIVIKTQFGKIIRVG